MKNLKVSLAAAICVLLLAGCGENDADERFLGYIEADLVNVSAANAEYIDELLAIRGARVERGEVLFTQRDSAELARVRAAEQSVAAAKAELQDLLTGRRKVELEVVEAQLRQARVDHEHAQREVTRKEALAAGGTVSAVLLDTATTRARVAAARVEELEAQISSLRLGGRDAQVRAAHARVEAAVASLDLANDALKKLSTASPVSGTVFDVYYRQGEFLRAGAPAVAVLPDNALKLRFFVPVDALPDLKIGRTVKASVDGAAAPVPARVSYVAAKPEFSPPLIYSRDARKKLVFLVEAMLEAPEGVALHPGQPVDVVLE